MRIVRHAQRERLPSARPLRTLCDGEAFLSSEDQEQPLLAVRGTGKDGVIRMRMRGSWHGLPVADEIEGGEGGFCDAGAGVMRALRLDVHPLVNEDAGDGERGKIVPIGSVRERRGAKQLPDQRAVNVDEGLDLVVRALDPAECFRMRRRLMEGGGDGEMGAVAAQVDGDRVLDGETGLDAISAQQVKMLFSKSGWALGELIVIPLRFRLRASEERGPLLIGHRFVGEEDDGDGAIFRSACERGCKQQDQGREALREMPESTR